MRFIFRQHVRIKRKIHCHYRPEGLQCRNYTCFGLAAEGIRGKCSTKIALIDEFHATETGRQHHECRPCRHLNILSSSVITATLARTWFSTEHKNSYHKEKHAHENQELLSFRKEFYEHANSPGICSVGNLNNRKHMGAIQILFNVTEFRAMITAFFTFGGS